MSAICSIHCSACLFLFDSVEYLILHLRDLIDDKLHCTAHYKCYKCAANCQGVFAFRQHLEFNHSNNDVDSFTLQNNVLSGNRIIAKQACKYCEKSFRKSLDLVRHLRTHTNEKPFLCWVCNRAFKLKSTLDGHLKTHQPQSLCDHFSCSFCKKNFLSLSALKLHIRIHTNETPFLCVAHNCHQSFRTKKLMLTHFRNFHRFSSNATYVNNFKSIPNVSTLYAKKGVMNSLKQISLLEGQPLITSQNSAFSEIPKKNVVGKNISHNFIMTARVIVIRVQVRSGSVVAGSSAGQTPTDIILEPSALINLSRNGYFMYIALKKTGLPLNLALSVDPNSVLSRLEFQSTSISQSLSHCFTSVVYPTVEHVICNPPLPFSVLCSEEEDLRKIRGHMPSFLIECFLAANHSNQFEAERRQVLAQSCLPMLWNDNGVECVDV